MKNLDYPCPKCGNTSYKIGQMRATVGALSKIFDVQSQKFSSVSCESCAYTVPIAIGVYKSKTRLSNVFDFFTS